MANVEVGQVVKTGNSVINSLPEGSVLVVSGPGEFEVVEIGDEDDVEIVPGVKFTSKRGEVATVVDLTSTGGLNKAQADGVVFYVEDGVNRVRRTNADFVQDNLL